MWTAQSGCWLRSGGFQKQPDSGFGFLRIWMFLVFLRIGSVLSDGLDWFVFQLDLDKVFFKG